MFLAIQSDANGVPKRRNMWSHVSHQPPMSKNSGETGFGQCRSSRIQNSSFSPGSQSIGKSSDPKNVSSACSVGLAAMAAVSSLDLRLPAGPLAKHHR